MAAELLVTGHSGFVGRRLMRALEARGYAVCGYSRAAGDIARDPLPPTETIRHVFHLAGESFVPESWHSPLPFYRTNVVGTANVMKFCRDSGATITFVSSYVYGQPKSLPIREDHAVSAANPYAHSKILAEEIVRFYAEMWNVTATILRPFNLYGPGQDRRFVIPTLVAKALDPTSEYIEIADERPKRDFLYVDDFIELLVATISRPGGICNAGCGSSVSVAHLADMICQQAGVKKRVVSRNESRPNEILDVVADVSRASHVYGWVPHTSLQEGLAATLQAYGQSLSLTPVASR